MISRRALFSFFATLLFVGVAKAQSIIMQNPLSLPQETWVLETMPHPTKGWEHTFARLRKKHDAVPLEKPFVPGLPKWREQLRFEATLLSNTDK